MGNFRHGHDWHHPVQEASFEPTVRYRQEPRMRARHLIAIALLAAPISAAIAQNAAPADPRLEKLKAEALTAVEGKAKMVQEIVDMLFSFGELGFQESPVFQRPG
jgi:hypothetical protein